MTQFYKLSFDEQGNEQIAPISCGRGKTKITSKLLEGLGFIAGTDNAGTLPCFRIKITTHTSRVFTIAKWGVNPNGLQEWQIWINRFDLTRLCYIEDVNGLLQSMAGAVPRRESQIVNLN